MTYVIPQSTLEKINETPELMSILYDLNMLPEQVCDETYNEILTYICEAFFAGRKSAKQDCHTDNEECLCALGVILFWA